MLACACVRAWRAGVFYACLQTVHLSVLRHALSYVVNKMGFVSKGSGLGGSRDLFGSEF